ncbi:parathyroid hormone/parathyroid hormone-related peptide receptor isoform X2 [Fopius arisanus]|nr:PREDICTED: parathyroid hormone/parathyroid hormone-related peptide receptor-like isoform X2 [Fopius arisanus]XP_011306401.1 PREDICTED: parathyroid hormone/parathyroid hormone-related peptide receptor-like isoform X2 [Fopius arisanus]
MANHNTIDFNSPTIQEQLRELGARKCHNGSIPSPGWCSETWDGILCWPATAPGDLAVQSCPRYIAGFDLQANASRQCLPDGQWFMKSETNSTWSNYTQCYATQYVTVLMDITEIQERNATLIKKYLPIVTKTSTIGYAVSFSTLLFAFLILATIKKLRCPRNMLHLHLFASFMTRAFMALLKDVLHVSGLRLASDLITKNGESFWREDAIMEHIDNNWQCKLFTSLWQYFILANYSWILMEGLYLHNLVFFALFTDSNSSIMGYVLLGWGLPAIFVIPWVIVRALYDDNYCWTTNVVPELFLIIRIPTTLSILINFVLFINIVRVLLSKLKSTVCEETQRYKRWARSTLVLVPLFGVHYTVFLVLWYSMGTDQRVELIWLFGDQLFASFQGFFVAVLYCFLNGEVRTELARVLRSKKWPRLRGRWGPRHSTRSNSACSCNGKSGKSRKSWWKTPWLGLFHQSTIHRSTHSMASTQDVATRGGSLASSRGYLDSVGVGPGILDSHEHPTTHTSPLCSKYTDHSVLSFCSHMSDVSTYPIRMMEKTEKPPEHRCSADFECCSLAFELHNYPHEIP